MKKTYTVKLEVNNMYKANLYYIVLQGTDSCVSNESGEPIIFLSNHVDRYLEEIENTKPGAKYWKVSVEEYERTFTESWRE